MSACPSLPISVAATCPGQALASSDPVPVDLLAVLVLVEGPRSRRGVRHRFVAVLAIGVWAMLAGARTFTAIAEWDLTPAVRIWLVRCVSCWVLAARRRASRRSAAFCRPSTPKFSTGPLGLAGDPIRPSTTALRMIASDGKRARGARGPDDRAVHLLAAFDQLGGVVLGQTVVDGCTLSTATPTTSWVGVRIRCSQSSASNPACTETVRRPRAASAALPLIAARPHSASCGHRPRRQWCPSRW